MNIESEKSSEAVGAPSIVCTLNILCVLLYYFRC